MKPIVGSIVALVTPMHEDGSVDYPALRRLIDWHIAEGTDCIGVVGTTGESPTVTVDEHCEIIRVAVEQAAKRVPIMAGTGVARGRKSGLHSPGSAWCGWNCPTMSSSVMNWSLSRRCRKPMRRSITNASTPTTPISSIPRR